MMNIKGVLLQTFINSLIKKASTMCANKFASGAIQNENMSKKEVAEELHKLIVRKFEKRKVPSSFIDNV